MGRLEAKTTHTVKLSWPREEPLEKSILIRGLSDTLPDAALVTDLAVDDVARTNPNRDFPDMIRTLTITYLDTPARAHYRRP